MATLERQSAFLGEYPKVVMLFVLRALYLAMLVMGRGGKATRQRGNKATRHGAGQEGADWALIRAAVIQFSKSSGSGLAGPVEEL